MAAPRSCTALTAPAAGALGALAFASGYLLGRWAGSWKPQQTASSWTSSSSSAPAPSPEAAEASVRGVRFWVGGEEFEQVREIVRMVVRGFDAVPIDRITVREVPGGITNRLYRAGIGEGGRAVLLRVFGAESMIDRRVENATYIWLAKEGVAPFYYGRFLNGRIEEYYGGYLPFTLEDMQKRKLSTLLARQVARLHKLKVPPEIKKLHSGMALWEVVETWLKQAKAHKNYIPSSQMPSPLDSPMATPIPSRTPSPNRRDGESDVKTESCSSEKENTFPTLGLPASSQNQDNTQHRVGTCVTKKGDAEKRKALPKEALQQYFSIDFNRCAAKIQATRKAIDHPGDFKILTKTGDVAIIDQARDKRIVFCHNDLLCGNILRNQSNTVVRLIDFEYGGIGYRGFDIANHFNEWAGGTLESEEDKPGYNGRPDYTRFPSKEQQYAFCEAYLQEFYGRAKSEEVKNLLEEVECFITINHFYWGLWAINRAFEEGVSKFDYMRYGIIRIMRGLEEDAW